MREFQTLNEYKKKLSTTNYSFSSPLIKKELKLRQTDAHLETHASKIYQGLTLKHFQSFFIIGLKNKGIEE